MVVELPEKVILAPLSAPPFVVSIVNPVPNATGPVIVTVPLVTVVVVMLAPFRWIAEAM